MNNLVTYGYIIKDNVFSTLETHIIKNTLVLEETCPFPGYHGKNLPDYDNKPCNIFFITKGKVTFEKLHRMQNSISKIYASSFVMDMGEIYHDKETFPFLRLKNLENYNSIFEIQELIKNEGVFFEKHKKFTEKVIVKVDKYFDIEPINEGIYRDNEIRNIYYLEIPEFLEWNRFTKITDAVRNNLNSFPAFDAAVALFYFKTGLLDAVRIYCDKLSIEMLIQLRNKYLHEIEKF